MLRDLEKGDVRALHRTRIATRRLRELLPVLQLDGHTADKLARRLRKITDRLGSVRELDVLSALVAELRTSGRHVADALILLGAGIDKERKTLRKKVMAKAPIGELHRLADKLGRVADAMESADPPAGTLRQAARRSWWWAADARVSQRAGRLAEAIDVAGGVYLPGRLHHVRIALKKLRYALEVAGEAGGVIQTTDLRTLKRGQDLLGRIHDFQILVDRTRQVQASLTPPSVVLWRSLDATVDAIEGDCRRLHGRYMRERTALTELCKRIGPRGRSVSRRMVTA